MGGLNWRCLKCGLELSKYSRPHMPKPTEGYHKRVALLVTGNWSSYEDIPKSVRTMNDICWGTVVNTPKYNKPL